MDEPLSALDKKLREEMQIELKQLHRQLGVTTVYVTHDQREALTMSDRIAVINDGELAQIGTPRDIYNNPAESFCLPVLLERSDVFVTQKERLRFLFFGTQRISKVSNQASTKIGLWLYGQSDYRYKTQIHGKLKANSILKVALLNSSIRVRLP